MNKRPAGSGVRHRAKNLGNIGPCTNSYLVLSRSIFVVVLLLFVCIYFSQNNKMCRLELLRERS